MLLVHMKTQIDQRAVGGKSGATARAAINVWWILVMAGLAAATAGWFFWRQRQLPPAPEVAAATPAVVLTDATVKILTSLEKNVEVKFFVPRDPGLLPSELQAYVGRITDLLLEYERVATGKILVAHCDPQTDAGAKAAAGVAGVTPVATEHGEIYYLGLTVGNESRRETIAPLAPEWEAALESDLSRAILRVSAKTPVGVGGNTSPATPAQPAPIDPAISEELLRTFPDLASRSFDDLALSLRQRTLEDFKIAAAELQTKMAEAQKKLAAAQANKSEAAQQEAAKELEQLQTVQANKLGGITARLQERIVTLQQLKAASKLPAATP